jgi:hypothetical protein
VVAGGCVACRLSPERNGKRVVHREQSRLEATDAWRRQLWEPRIAQRCAQCFGARWHVLSDNPTALRRPRGSPSGRSRIAVVRSAQCASLVCGGEMLVSGEEQVSLPAVIGRPDLAWRSDAGDPRVVQLDQGDHGALVSSGEKRHHNTDLRSSCGRPVSQVGGVGRVLVRASAL